MIYTRDEIKHATSVLFETLNDLNAPAYIVTDFERVFDWIDLEGGVPICEPEED